MTARLWTAIRATFTWRRMCDASSDHRYADALEIARSFNVPEIRRKPFWRVFEIQHLGLLNQDEATLTLALDFVNEMATSDQMSPDSEYFLLFARWYGQVAHRALFSDLPVPSSLLFDLTTAPKLGDVSSQWKRAFPMPIHPDWDDRVRASKQGVE